MFSFKNDDIAQIGAMSIKYFDGAVDSRRKIRRLAETLGFDMIHATRLEAVFSEICHFSCRNDSSVSVEVSIVTLETRLALCFLFESKAAINRVPGVQNFFDFTSYEEDMTGKTRLQVIRFLPDSGLIFNDEIYDHLRTIVTSPSRTS